ncbi:MAG: carboxypeptidase regulatory-like domain-containing protein [Bryobacteraceae bacterium]|nr:carboxypeptidase regulatory-like domain-containing protein [Bryobacteraceae bacterium]
MSWIAVVCAAAASGCMAFGQTSGVVTSSGRPLPGATVTWTVNGQTQSVATDEQGRFALDPAPSGPVEADIRLFGFQAKRITLNPTTPAQPFQVTLDMAALRPVVAAAKANARGTNGRFQNTELMRNLESDIASALSSNGATQQMATSDSTESFLVQGSLSRGLERVDNLMMFGPEGPGGPGGPGGMGGPGQVAPGFGTTTQEGQSQVAQTAGQPGGEGPGGAMGGRPGPGGMGGGPPGGMMGGPGGGGPGGMGGRGGGPGGGFGRMDPEAMKERLAQMSPEERKRVEEMMAGRDRMRGGEQAVFGNRASRRNRDMLRGGAFIEGRNSALDASPYALNGNTVTKPDYSQIRFGASIGGMLRIPKLLSSEGGMFFLNYGGTRSRSPYSNFAVMPGDTERSGDFSQLTSTTIYDPLSGLPFAGNSIPAARISAAAAGLLKLIPTPNQSGGIQNYSFITSLPNNSDNLSLRLSQSIGRKDRISFNTSWQQRSGESAQLYGWRDASEGSGTNYDFTWNHTYSARFIINARASYNRNRNAVVPYFAYGDDISGALGITGNSRVPINYGPPNLSFTNYGDLNDAGHSLRRNHTFTYSGGITSLLGKHSIRSGIEVKRMRLNTVAEQNPRGTFTFTGLSTSLIDASGKTISGTGYDLADFLLGLPQSSSIRYLGADVYLRSTSIAGYVQDDWRAHPSLSLSMGVRYEFFPPYTEKYNRMANIVANSAFTEVSVVTPGGTNPYTNEAIPSGMVVSDKNNFSPRFGLAWKPGKDGKTVVRTGYALFFDGSVFTRVPSALAAQPPFAVTSSFNTTTSNILTLTDGFTGPISKTVTNTYSVNPDYVVPYAQTWNFSIQRTLPAGYTLDVGYLGTKGTKLVLSRLPNRAPTGSAADSEDNRVIGNAVGFTYESPEGNSIYHAGQIRLNKRMRRGLALGALYTYSKSIDNASTFGGAGNVVAQDDSNLAAERALSSFDRRHQLSLNGMYSSPVTGTRTRGLPRWAVNALRDWTIGFGITAQTGTPFTARVLGTASDAGGTGAIGSARADSTGASIESSTGYFNLAAFTVPSSGTYGNAARNTIPGQPMVLINANVGRSLQLGKETRRQIELRASANNLLNHANITGLGTVVNSINYGLATSAGDMRSVTVSLRLRF